MPHPLVVHFRKSPYDVFIGRTRQGNRWSNPFTDKEVDTLAMVRVGSRAEAIEAYREWLAGHRTVPGLTPPTREEIVRELRGKVLGCWCAPRACHGDVLAAIANDEPATTRGGQYAMGI
jgi:hypothetical protein